MKINRSVRFGIGIMAIAFAATACGGGEENKSITESASDGTLTVGIKFDQPFNLEQLAGTRASLGRTLADSKPRRAERRSGSRVH